MPDVRPPRARRGARELLLAPGRRSAPHAGLLSGDPGDEDWDEDDEDEDEADDDEDEDEGEEPEWYVAPTASR